jgi:hypothetical protein
MVKLELSFVPEIFNLIYKDCNKSNYTLYFNLDEKPTATALYMKILKEFYHI